MTCAVASILVAIGFFPLLAGPGKIGGHEYQVDDDPDTKKSNERITAIIGLNHRRLFRISVLSFAHDCRDIDGYQPVYATRTR